MNTHARNTTFGVEIEMTGISRQAAAEAVGQVLGAHISEPYGAHDYYRVYPDTQGRAWYIMRDVSILEQGFGCGMQVELVTPPLTYDADMKLLQQVVRALRRAGAVVNASCGMHIHIDGAEHTAKSLRNWVNLVAGRNALLHKAIQLDPERKHWCKELDAGMVERMQHNKPRTLEALKDIWYNAYDDHEDRYIHYHHSRYHFLNLHSFFQSDHHTIELRGFNATLHAGKVRSYVALTLALNEQALTQSRVSARVPQTDNEKFAMRTWLTRIGLNGGEFKACREHLIKHLDGCAAWRYGADAPHYTHNIAQSVA